MASLAGLDTYIEAMESVEGWFEPEDVYLFDGMLSAQQRLIGSGDILEIGTYRGKSAIALGYGVNRRNNEELVICDPFERLPEHKHAESNIASLNPDGCDINHFDAAHFLANWDKYHDWEPEIWKCESAELKLRRRVRFAHIDGCHSYSCVRRDIGLCAAALTDKGVLAIDDYRNSRVPGVAAATWEAAQIRADGRRGIYPFCLSVGKLYAATSPQAQKFWLDVATGWIDYGNWRGSVYPLSGIEVVTIWHEYPQEETEAEEE